MSWSVAPVSMDRVDGTALLVESAHFHLSTFLFYGKCASGDQEREAMVSGIKLRLND